MIDISPLEKSIARVTGEIHTSRAQKLSNAHALQERSKRSHDALDWGSFPRLPGPDTDPAWDTGLDAIVPEPFKARVRAALDQARAECYELLDLSIEGAPRRRCKGCQCLLEDTTPGCRTCYGRHRYTKKPKAERPATYKQVTKKHCKGCSCPVDDQTPGCQRCASRHYMRERYAAKQAARRL